MVPVTRQTERQTLSIKKAGIKLLNFDWYKVTKFLIGD